MTTYYLKSTVATDYAKNTAYSLGQRVVPAIADTGTNYLNARKYVWECTTAGTTDATNYPTWDASYTPNVSTETSGTATFTCRLPTTWVNAAKYSAYLSNLVAAGDTVWVSNNHAESSTLTANNFNGTKASPTNVLCGDDASEPPTALATTGTITNTGSNYNNISGSGYFYGLTIVGASGSNASDVGTQLNSAGGVHKQIYDTCHVNCATTGSGVLVIGYQGTSVYPNLTTELRNSTVQFGAAGCRMVASGNVIWSGGSITLGTAPTSLFGTFNSYTTNTARVLVENVDLSNMGSYLVNIASSPGSKYKFRNCKLKSGWAAITGTDPGPGWEVEVENCSTDDGNLPIVSQYHNYWGSVVQETTIKVTTGGASDGTNTFSWKMTCDADCEWPIGFLASPEIAVWNTTVGSAVTLSVEINHDSQGSGTSGRMTDKDMWLEVRYLGTSGSPLGKTLTNAVGASTSVPFGTPLPTASASDHPTSAVAWSGTITNPEPQTLSVQVTPQEIGYIHVRVCCAKASAVVYVDPKVTVS